MYIHLESLEEFKICYEKDTDFKKTYEAYLQHKKDERFDYEFIVNSKDFFLRKMYSLLVHSAGKKDAPKMNEMINEFVKENEMVKVVSYQGNPFTVEPPLFVELAVTATEPGFKGDTAQGATKPATVETGATVQVPLFVNEGDVLKIDTRTGEYLSRV